MFLLNSYKLSEVTRHVAYLNHELGNNKPIKNPPGWLRRSLQNRWSAPTGFVPPEELEKRKALKAENQHQKREQQKEAQLKKREGERRKAELISWLSNQPNENENS